MKYNEDDRAQRLLDIFPLTNGQINVSYVNSTKHIVAWHMHKKQTDYWICLKGSFKIGLVQPPYSNVIWEFLSDKYPRMLTIPPETYHGYQALEPGSILLYYLDHKYDPTDELREIPGKFSENWGIEDK